MKDSTRQALCAVQKLTQKLCEGCNATSPYRCCERDFCIAVERGLLAVGKSIPRTDHPQLPFMGPSGCVVPAELRPGCSGYVCEDRLDTRPLRREYDRLHDKFMGDPDVEKMLGAATRHLFLMRGKPKRFKL